MLYDCDMFYFGNKEWQEIQLQIEIQICTKYLYLHLCIYICICVFLVCLCVFVFVIQAYLCILIGIEAPYFIIQTSCICVLGRLCKSLHYTEAERMMIGLWTETTRRKGDDGICICICIAIGRMVQWSGTKTRNKPKLMRIGRSQQKYTL